MGGCGAAPGGQASKTTIMIARAKGVPGSKAKGKRQKAKREEKEGTLFFLPFAFYLLPS
jgi:hypothetical protein